MNARIEYALASDFGPPSEPIDMTKFVQDATSLPHSVPDVLGPEIDRTAIAEECSVEDIRSSLTDTWSNPRLSAYLCKGHDKAITNIHVLKSSKLAKARKRTNPASEPYAELQEVKQLQAKLDAVPLSSWKLMPDAALFTRPPRNTDYNTLTATKSSDTDMDAPLDADSAQVIITITTHSKVYWRTSVLSKNSQHVLSGSQTLGTYLKRYPVGVDRMNGSSGCVVVINDLAYGDGLSEEDYADKFIQHLKITKSVRNIKKATTMMHDTPLSSLALQINVPYWLLHQGNCEHFIVIDEIRHVGCCSHYHSS
ncbi:hypothetical protein BDP27DRAFT_1415229 [Rhodocollybia butyracea]|uniref:snRNA-activating protein complex subunit 3 n=1 Tax=Rhodocollybia butyracea TaxID=206335 RepID=A0A9P5UDR0_9AGAR|nr:hypothetical protein BDP27DRAFT_1415229 [Rhodocollybia butyracea]